MIHRFFSGLTPLLTLTLFLLPLVMSTHAMSSTSTLEPADVVEVRYQQAVRVFSDQTGKFKGTVESLPANAEGTRLLRREVARLRASYKAIEYLVDYAHPGSAARLNPAPLERADMTSPDAMTVLQPEGLQIILETVHENQPLKDHRETLKWQAMRLAYAARELEAAAASIVLDDRMLFEAMQAQVIRIMATGITGFDAPATERSLPEARIALESIRPTLALYLPAIKQHDPGLARRVIASLDAALRAIPVKAEFDTFDRLTFIRTAGNPLYAALVDAHHALNITTFADLAPLRRPVSTTARNLFARDFLDPYYYSLTIGDKPNKAAAELGRKLFFDPLLSTDGMRSCASCHDPRRAFTDGLPKSPALTGGVLPRNSPSLTHAAYQSAQFWDMRETTLEKQIVHVITGAEEFRNDFLVILKRLERHPQYPDLFRAAFGGDTNMSGRDIAAQPIHMATVTKSLSHFIRSLDNWGSPFDQYVRGETEFLDPAAKRGFNLFMGKAACATCHFPPTFGGIVPPRYIETESEVLGVPEFFPAPKGSTLRFDGDLGRGLVHQNAIFQRAFKTPTVRNAELTAPYMHNGGMNTLEDVMDFYNAGGGAGLGLEVPHQTLPPDSLGLTKREISDIIAFMKSLTDTTGLGGSTEMGY
jgi:cytochrome c peroxidase